MTHGRDLVAEEVFRKGEPALSLCECALRGEQAPERRST
jgi:hypothetical protein